MKVVMLKHNSFKFTKKKAENNIFSIEQIMLDLPDDINGLLAGKTAMKYTGTEVDAMRAVAESAKKRLLSDFNQVCSASLSPSTYAPNHFQCLFFLMNHFRLQYNSNITKYWSAYLLISFNKVGIILAQGGVRGVHVVPI